MFVMLDKKKKKKHPERIKQNDKKITEKFGYDGIEFPVQEKDFKKLK